MAEENTKKPIPRPPEKSGRPVENSAEPSKPLRPSPRRPKFTKKRR